MNPITYTYTGNVQSYDVTITGTYSLAAFGAQGGSGGSSATGGLGASVAGDFALQSGTQLLFLVGQQGGNGGQSPFVGAGGGGGGSFVYLDADRSGTINAGDTLLLAAGGGGGAGPRGNGGIGTAADAGSGNGGGGLAGGGQRPSAGGGGAGINGGGGNAAGDQSGSGAASIQTGGRGTTFIGGGAGGYGGGGGGGFNGGGGGGGYSGGAGGNSDPQSGGSGGRSFFDTTRGVRTATTGGTNSGDGSVAVTCYVTGTAIRVWRSGAEADVAMEDLCVGDLAVTAEGRHRPIRWIGHRTIDLRRHPAPQDAQPVRIQAHAFGPNSPVRDLVVSPGHSLAVDVCGEVLIPASALINGATITQESVETVTYWHVELDTHDLLLAENQPAESYLDMGNRAFFTEGGVVALHAGPDADAAGRTHADFCRPFHAAGPLVEVVRARLAARAAMLDAERARPAVEMRRAG